jgi:ribose/xylose/arabinose/galactoside ABC-type transport system permease subunit
MESVTTDVKGDGTRGKAARPGIWESIKGLFTVTEFVIFLIVIILLVVGTIINPRLMAGDNLKIMTRDVGILAIAAIGVGFTIITAGIDLSVGSMVGFGGVMSAYFMMHDSRAVRNQVEHAWLPHYVGDYGCSPGFYLGCNQCLPDHGPATVI